MMIINDDYRVITKLESSLTDDARVIIYNRHMFIVQATDVSKQWENLVFQHLLTFYKVRLTDSFSLFAKIDAYVINFGEDK
jgi:hypothetical protein